MAKRMQKIVTGKGGTFASRKQTVKAVCMGLDEAGQSVWRDRLTDTIVLSVKKDGESLLMADARYSIGMSADSTPMLVHDTNGVAQTSPGLFRFSAAAIGEVPDNDKIKALSNLFRLAESGHRELAVKRVGLDFQLQLVETE